MEKKEEKVLLDVFDFDGTIYDGDSTADFMKFALKRRPLLALACVPPLLSAAGTKLTGSFTLTKFKSGLFSALARRLSLEEEARAFWESDKTRGKLGRWFVEREKTLPVVIASASPDFELRYAAELLEADALICTRCDPVTGKLIGENCKSAEKIRRIGERFGPFEVRAMYTDDPKADGPLLALAGEKYLVRHGQVRRMDETP